MGVPEGRRRRLIFTYGTLKKGFSNHHLMEDLITSGDAVFIGSYRTADNYPLVCGPYRVPFLLNLPGRTGSHHVWGEAYEVSDSAVVKMDELEGITRGHYERLPTRLCSAGGDDAAVVEAEAYFAHRSYAEEMWRRNGERGYAVYSEKEAKGYVKRKDRPQHLTFLDQIDLFLSEPPQR